MVTDLGKFLRKLRIDRGEVLADMGKRLGVSAAYLSCIETGKKVMPVSWCDKICRIYQLDKEQQKELVSIFAEADGCVEIDLHDAADRQKQLAVLFAVELCGLNDEQAERIMDVLNDAE